MTSHGGVLQLSDGSLWAVDVEGGVVEPLLESFRTPCPRMEAFRTDDAEDASPHAPIRCGPLAAVGLSRRGELFAGAALVAKGVTSFSLRRDGPGGTFLLLTTREETLRTLRLADVLKVADTLSKGSSHRVADAAAAAPTVLDVMGADAISTRAIERGALLVATPPGARCALHP